MRGQRMAKHGATDGTPEPRDRHGTEQSEKRLEEELLTQEYLESLAWPIWSDLATRISRSIQAYNTSPDAGTRLHLVSGPEPYQMVVESNPAGKALRIRLNTQTGVISFGDLALASEERLVIRIESQTSYRIERDPGAEVVNPGDLAGVILGNFLRLVSGD
jgi:hypothetical protein